MITENLDLNSAMLDSHVSVITENLDLNSAMLDSVSLRHTTTGGECIPTEQLYQCFIQVLQYLKVT